MDDKMSGYTPLFPSIVTSSIWNEDNTVRIVWITMLAMADVDGNVEASVVGLAPVARVTTEECRKAIKILSSPDPDSRTKEAEGRRITPIDGGWHLVNHRKYREKAKSRAVYLSQWRKEKKEKNQKKEEEQTNTKTHTHTRNTLKHRETKQSVSRERKPKFIPPTFEEVRDYIRENPELSNMTAEGFLKDYSPAWIDTQGKPVRNWKLKLRTRSKYATGQQKSRLLPLLPAKICSRDGCRMPAVYKDTSGSYDHVYCANHMPEKVKEHYK